MKARKYLWWGLGILLAGFALLWLVRLWWLPWLLRLVLSRYEVDRLRYEAAQWDHPAEWTFFQLRLDKGSWHLEADTVSVSLWPSRKVSLGHARLWRSTDAPTGEPTPPALLSKSQVSLVAIRRLLRQLERIDTLSVIALEGPLEGTISLHKAGQTWHARVCRDTVCLNSSGEIYEDNIRFTCPAGRFSLPSGFFLAWDSLFGSVEVSLQAFSAELRGYRWEAFHRRVASRPLHYDSAGVVVQGYEGSDSLRLIVQPLQLPLQAELRSVWNKVDSTVELYLTIPRQPHSAFLRAFPAGFWTALGQAQLEGTSALAFRLRYDPALPETLALDIDWRPEGFNIRAWPGRSPLLLRETIIYRPYRSSRQILLGPENPDYLTFRQITPYVLHAVLHSEDGIFFYHQGFQKDRFLQAMRENWRCRCFRRGAGTITMQLVRNLLLTREKTLSRKVEEILLTALIERFGLLSKQRIAELYFNMVEWGPEVYGLTEAAHFYFAKPPHELTIPEAIFLGVLLPQPKAYRYFVDRQTGCALPSLAGHFRTIARYLVLQNYLPEDSIEAMQTERVCLKPPAWPKDTLSVVP